MKINGNKILKGITIIGLAVCAADAILDLAACVREMRERRDACGSCNCDGCCDCSGIDGCPKEMHMGCECCPSKMEEDESDGCCGCEPVPEEPVQAPEQKPEV